MSYYEFHFVVVPLPLFILPFKKVHLAVAIIDDQFRVVAVQKTANILDELALKRKWERQHEHGDIIDVHAFAKKLTS